MNSKWRCDVTRLLGLIVLIGAFARPAGAQTTLGYQIRVALGNGNVRYINCAFGPDNRLYVVYGHSGFNPFLNVTNENPIWMVTFDGIEPSTPFNVTGTASVDAFQPDIFVGKTGLITVVWSQQAAGAVFLRTYNPTTNSWGTIETIAQGYGNYEPAVVVDSQDNIFVSWHVALSGGIFSRAKINGQWDSIYYHPYVGLAKQHHLALGPDDVVHLVWIDKNYGTFTGRYTKRSRTSFWTDPEEWAIQGEPTHPSITITPDNVPWVASGDAVEPYELYAEIWVMNLNNPTQRYKIGANISQHYPHIVSDSDGKLHVAIQRGGNDIGDGVLYANNILNNFQDLQYLPGTYNMQQGMASDGTGNTALCWTSLNLGQNSSEIYVATLKPVSVTPPPPPPVPPSPPLNPRVVSITVSIPREMTALTPTFSLAWSKNSLNDDADLTGYRIYTKGTTGDWTAVLNLGVNAVSASIQIDSRQKVQIAITAVGTNGLESEKALFSYGTTSLAKRR